MKTVIVAVSALFAGALASATAEETSVTHEQPVQVMVLGTYHFGNPGLDLVNTEADDVLLPKRQAELETLADRLLEFQPTAIAIESIRRTEDVLDPEFREFTPDDLTRQRNESVQIGYRVAHEAGIDRVYAVDKQEGDVSYFPFDRIEAFAERTNRQDEITSKIETIKVQAQGLMRDQATTSIAELLARQNDPEVIDDMHSSFYYGLLNMTDAEDNAGAALNYGWYARNAEIFATIAEIAQPGDRILVIYGSGHNYWLRHFAEETPGFELVEPNDYLID